MNHTHAEPSNTFHESLTAQFGIKPDGKLLVSLPTEGLLYRVGRSLAAFRGHYHKSHASEIHKEIVNVGFEVKRIEKIPAAGPLAFYWVIDYGLSR